MISPNCHRANKRVVTSGAIFLALVSHMVTAQTVTTIRTDTSWDRTAQTLTPSGSNTVVTGNRGATYAIPGNVYTIAEAQGRLAGANLFHSFESFSIGSGDAAVFTTTTPTLDNVISRVSGASPTTINGLLALVPAVGNNPNFFFVNPNGITFGAGAQVDVPAAFHVSTADHLRFADGTVFKAGNGSDSTLTIAPPEAFGFLGTRRASVEVVDGAGVSTWPTASISVTAGDILVDRAVIGTAASDIRLAAAGQAEMEIPLTGSLPPAFGNLIVADGAQVYSSNWGQLAGGNVRISAGNTIIDGQSQVTGIFTFTDGAGDAGSIETTTQESLAIVNGGLIRSITFAAGNAGTVNIAAHDVLIDRAGSPSSTGIGSQTASGSAGNAANIGLTVTDTLTLLAGAQINASSFGAGDAGTVQVATQSFLVDGWGSLIPTGIGIQSLGSGTGTTASRIDVTVKDDLAILNGGTFSSSSFSSRDGGSISVSAGNITLQGNDALGVTGIFTDAEGSGRGGDLNVTASGDIRILLGSEISSSTFAGGDAGALKISARNLEIDGLGSSFFTGVSGNANSFSAGNAGSVGVVVSDTLTIHHGAEISSTTFSSGNAGAVEVSARNLVIDGAGSPLFTGIASGAGLGSTGGQGGSIKVTVAEALSVMTGGEIATSTFSTGNAGSIVINAGTVLMNDNGSPSVTGVFSNTYSAGQAGSLAVNAADDISIQAGATISSGTFSSGNGGSIAVTARNVSIEGLNSGIVAQAESSSTAGQAGSVEINAIDALTIRSGGFVSTSTLSSADAGSIKVAAGSVRLSGILSSIATTTEGTGQGGNILISAGQMTVEQLANITAETSGKGKAGNVTMTGDNLAVMSGGRIEASTSGEGKGGSIAVSVTGDVTVSGVNASGQSDTRSGLFAKTQSPSSGTGGGGGGGTGGGGTGGGGAGGGGGTTVQPGSAGNIAITAKNLLLNNGAQIDSSTTSGGAGGSVSITTAENITIAGSATSLKSDAPRGNGQGGSITMVAKNIKVSDGASVTAATGGKGDAGNITLTAVDQLLLQSSGKITTSTSGDGKGGSVVIQAGRVLLDGSDTAIIADTLRPFADLTVTINILHASDGDLVVQLDSPTGTRVALLSRVGGSGDNFTGTGFNDQATNPITSGSAPFTGTFTPREPLAQLINELTAGNWTLNVRDQATGNVGTLQNWTLQIGGQTFQSAGTPISIPDNGALQSTITVANPNVPTVQGTGEAKGTGGDVTVTAGSVTVQNGAAMSAITRGSGKGGIVNLQVAGDVSVLNNGRIATDTFGSGQAGSINVEAGQIVVDGQGSAFLAGAQMGSSGQTGSLTVKATNAVTLSNGGILSISNDATVPNPGALTPTLLSVSAPNITLKDASITAESTGNSNASDIQILFTGSLVVDPSSITTSANLGNGGDITIGGGQIVQLDNSQITTSVGGVTGNGGDINIQATSLVLNTGFIQANTAAAGASGGNVNINVQTLLPSGNSLIIGGNEPAVFQPGVFGLNVIQAAAPTGVSGTIHSTVPTLDVAENLSGLTAKVIDFGALGKDLCRMGARSSFTPVGRGGLRPGSTGMIRPEGALAQTTASEAQTGGHVAIADMRDGTRLGALAECRY